ncbi:TFIIH/NER complex subunit [Tulasnella sp. 427]|nr:TFIIH/NER complex subunit [Tulasnella sp. 427]
MASRLSTLRGGAQKHGSRSQSRSAFTSRVSSPAPPQPSTYSMHTPVKDPTGKTTEYRDENDTCPVCKSDRFLNKNLRLLVSPCYHRMFVSPKAISSASPTCEGCIDRIFTLGPAPCPIPGCGTTLRKMQFIHQTFEDLTVEKEVGVRRRIAKEFNKRRQDFSDLRSYNDYLELVEDITFNLINNINVRETEELIEKNRRDNAALIELNIQRDERDISSLQEEEARERREREQRAADIRRLEEEEKLEKEREKQAIIDGLAKSNTDADRLIAKTRAEAAKRSQARRRPDISNLLSSSAPGSSYGRTNTVAAKDEPHQPFTDDWDDCHDKFKLRLPGDQSPYYDPMTVEVRKDAEGKYRAGGFMLEEVWERALRCAVMGLDIAPLPEDVPAT